MFKNLQPLLSARAIAIVGASERARWPSQMYGNLRKFGFDGDVHPVNPRYGELWGRTCYPTLSAIPEPPEHALVIVPAARVVEIIEDGVRAGIKSATVYAAGVGDGPLADSHARGERLRAICAETGLVIGGPNCMGAMSWREKLFLYPNGAMPAFGPGPVGVVFQSGGTLQFWVQTTGARGVRFSYAISSGNELDVDLADYVNFLVEDPHTRVIALFIEGLRKPDAFREACARALAARKPVIAIKTGRTHLSRAAAESHTGAIGGDFQAFEAMCERYGVIVCPTLDDLTETVLAFQQPRLPRGRRVGFVTTSGGTVDLLYDHAEGTRVEFPAFSEATQARIRPEIPDDITIKNPLDSGIPRDVKTQAMFCAAVLDDPNIDTLVFAARTGRGPLEDEAPLKALVARTDKVVLGFERMRYVQGPGGEDFLDGLGIPFLQGMPETLRALDALSFYAERAGRVPPPLPPATGKAGNLVGLAFDRLLESSGVTLPAGWLAKDSDAAARAAAEIGFPVALKIVSPTFSHKTEVGGVLLGLGDEAAVRAGAATLEARVRAADGRAEITGFLVQEMVTGVEIIAGCRTDPIYGPVLLLGAGGVLVELVRDATMRLLPVTADDVHAMIAELRCKKLLEGWRGAPPADVEALVRAAVGLGNFFLDHRHLLDDLEINPLIVREAGRGVAAVDVRPVRKRLQGGVGWE